MATAFGVFSAENKVSCFLLGDEGIAGSPDLDGLFDSKVSLCG